MSPWGYIVKTALLVTSYAPFRDGLNMMQADATAAYNHIRSVSVTVASRAASAMRSAADTLAPQPSETSVFIPNRGAFDLGPRIQNLFSAATILVEVVKIYQNEQIRQELKGLHEQLRMYNNLVAGGASGPDGFARQVLDFLDIKVKEYAQDGGEHLFFIYHPDTNWHGAFARIAAQPAQQQPGGNGGADEARSRLLGVSHDFFAIFRLMLCARVALQQVLGDAATDISFHLLVPSYSVVAIPRSFVAIDALFPLTIDGQVAQGEPLVWLNFPSTEGYNRPILKDAGNLADLPENSWQEAATFGAVSATAAVTWLGITPLVVNAVLVTCPILAVPAIALGFVGTAGAMSASGRAVASCWEQPPPAILG